MLRAIAAPAAHTRLALRLSAVVDAKTSMLEHAEVVGDIECNCLLSGRPELTLHLAPSSKSGFKGVSRTDKKTPFRAAFHGRKLGSHATAEGAALVYARTEAHHTANPCGAPWGASRP